MNTEVPSAEAGEPPMPSGAADTDARRNGATKPGAWQRQHQSQVNWMRTCVKRSLGS